MPPDTLRQATSCQPASLMTSATRADRARRDRLGQVLICRRVTRYAADVVGPGIRYSSYTPSEQQEHQEWRIRDKAAPGRMHAASRSGALEVMDYADQRDRHRVEGVVGPNSSLITSPATEQHGGQPTATHLEHAGESHERHWRRGRRRPRLLVRLFGGDVQHALPAGGTDRIGDRVERHLRSLSSASTSLGDVIDSPPSPEHCGHCRGLFVQVGSAHRLSLTRASTGSPEAAGLRRRTKPMPSSNLWKGNRFAGDRAHAPGRARRTPVTDPHDSHR